MSHEERGVYSQDCIIPENIMVQKDALLVRLETGEVCLLNSEIEMIHGMDEGELDLPSVIILHHSLIERGWVWKMPGKYQKGARRYIDCQILDDVQPERSKMKPKIQITTFHGFVTKVKSEGAEIEVEVVEEDTGKEVIYTTQSCDRGNVLFTAEDANDFWLVNKH